MGTFDFTSTQEVQIDYNDITKAQATIIDLKPLTKSLTFLYNPAVPTVEDEVMTSRTTETDKSSRMVARGGRAIEVGGEKHEFAKFDPQPFIYTTSYTQAELNQYMARFKNNPEQSSLSAIRTRKIAKHLRTMYKSLNTLAILSCVGGVVPYPVSTGNGGFVNTDMNFGKIHSNTATDYTTNDFSITGAWGSGSIVTVIQDATKMLRYLRTKGVDTSGSKIVLGETAYAQLMTFCLSAPTATTLKFPTGINIQDVNNQYITVNGMTFWDGSDHISTMPDGTVKYLVEAKYMKILPAPEYNLWTYLTPDEVLANSPVMYFSKEWYSQNPSGRVIMTHARHFLVPDTNAIAVAQVIA